MLALAHHAHTLVGSNDGLCNTVENSWGPRKGRANLLATRMRMIHFQKIWIIYIYFYSLPDRIIFYLFRWWRTALIVPFPSQLIYVLYISDHIYQNCGELQWFWEIEFMWPGLMAVVIYIYRQRLLSAGLSGWYSSGFGIFPIWYSSRNSTDTCSPPGTVMVLHLIHTRTAWNLHNICTVMETRFEGISGSDDANEML